MSEAEAVVVKNDVKGSLRGGKGDYNNSEKMDSNLEVSDDIKKLITACVKAKDFSYSPYSKFRVGAALLTSDGSIVTGCNVENVSYGLTICAERTALVKAVSEGHRSFKAIAVTTDVVSNFTYPCGACRQFMAEFGDFDVYLSIGDGKLKKTSLKEILPYTFHKADLKEGQDNNST